MKPKYPKAPGFRLHCSTASFKRIIAPTDFSDVSLRSISQAIALAQLCSAELVLLHVIETFPIDYLVGLNDSKRLNAELEQHAQERIAELSEGIPYPRVRTLIRWGNPFREIVNAARELSADLIVLGTHGRTGLKHVYLGSTAERVVRHAKCTVVVTRG